MLLRYCRILALATLFVLTASCAVTKNNLSDNFILLEYKDFGPQAMAGELIGPKYWQWDSGRYSRPQVFDIKVVVYRNMTLSEVETLFPVDQKANKDYRYVEYSTAMEWYKKHIKQFNEDLNSSAGDKDITIYFLINLYESSLNIERALRK